MLPDGIGSTPIFARVEVIDEIYIMYDFPMIINVGPVCAASKQETQDSGFEPFN